MKKQGLLGGMIGTQGLSTRLVNNSVVVFSVAAFALIAFYLLRGGSPYPYTDDWMLVPFGTGEARMSLTWLWEQHVDHRIPIPKALWVWFLRGSGMDFRSVMLFNAATALIAALLLLKALARYRGHLMVGDLVVPLVLLNPSFNIFYWGFYLQFMSSIVLALVAISLGVLHFSSPKRGYAVAAAITIFCLNGVGMNGTTMALIFVPALVAALVRDRHHIRRWEFLASIMIASATVLISAYVVATWSPSGASIQEERGEIVERLTGILLPLYSLSAPRAWAKSVLPTDPYLIFGVVLSLVTGVLLLVKLLRKPSGMTLYLAGAFLASWAVLGAVAVGRAGFWSSGIEFHYGYFPTLTVMVSWVFLSIEMPRIVARTAAVGLLVVFGSMYMTGALWGLERANERAVQLAEIREDLANDVDLGTIVRENISLFWWQTNEEGIALMTKNLRMLDAKGILSR
jgi:hypothetical protein